MQWAENRPHPAICHAMDWIIVSPIHDRLPGNPMWHADESAPYWTDWYGQPAPNGSDGLTVDSEHDMWCAFYGGGGVLRLQTDGKFLHRNPRARQ